MKNKIIITGAAGFLGGRTAKYFSHYYPNAKITATSRRSTRADELTEHGCDFVAGDLTNSAFCETLTSGASIVIHCAAKSAPYGAYEDFYASNCIATEQLLKACIKNCVEKFIFISTPSIYFNYTNRYNVKETDALPKKMVNHYAKTKLMAEEMVLAYNGRGISTIALRPRAIIGAEDTVIFPRLLDAYKTNKIKIVGKGDNSCDFTCVRNVIEAIRCCIDADDTAYGKAYNITDGQTTNFWQALNYAFTQLDLPPIRRKVPRQIAMVAAGISELLAYLLQQKKEPAISRYGIGILTYSLSMDISEAKEKLNYTPVMSTYDGINEYIAWHNV